MTGKPIKYVFALFLALVILLGARMAFSDTLVLMSEMEGRLVNASSEPAAGVRLVRTWNWAFRNEQGQDETSTDANGVFNFPAVSGRSLTARLLPHEPDTYQAITAYHPNGPTEIWAASKTNYRYNGELQGRPLRVLCGLKDLPGDQNLRLFASRCIEAPDG